jgi:hypothetical protein
MFRRPLQMEAFFQYALIRGFGSLPSPHKNVGDNCGQDQYHNGDKKKIS